jgi:hypothetical protein
MILTGAADGRVAPKAAVGRKESWRAGDRKEWEQFSRLNEGFDLSSMSEDTHSADITDGDKVDANDPKRSFCLEQTSCEQFDIASDQSPIVSVIGRAGYCYECRQKTLARQGKGRVFG